MREETSEYRDMASAARAHNLNAGTAPLDGVNQACEAACAKTGPAIENGAQNKQIRVNLFLKATAFCFSVVTLSWFFEGLRQCKEVASPQGLAYLIGGTVCTLLLVVLQGFFIYCEERSKGRQTRSIALFEKWYLSLTSKQKGD